MTTLAAAAVHRRDHAVGADRVSKRFREVDVGTSIPEERRPGDDLAGAGGQDVLRARDRPHASAHAARQRSGDLPDEVEVVARTHRGIQVDDLHLRALLEPLHPAKHVVVPDRETLALHELDDGTVFEIDGRNQHQTADSFPRYDE